METIKTSKKKTILIGYAMINGIRFKLFHKDNFTAWRVTIGKNVFGSHFWGKELIGQMDNFSKMTSKQRDKLFSTK